MQNLTSARHCRIKLLCKSKWKQEYAIELNNRFKILENMEDEDNMDNNINEKWQNIKTIIKEKNNS